MLLRCQNQDLGTQPLGTNKVASGKILTGYDFH
jgi:hypothetical protein